MGILNNATEFVTSFMKRKPVVAGPPHLMTPVKFPHGPFQFRIQITPGATYEIQTSTDLKNWTTRSSGTAVGETVEYLDSDAPKHTFQFYRAIAGGTFPSRNVLGYATVSLPPGFSMIANPFNATSNAVATILPGMPDGTTLSKFDTSLFRLTDNSVKNGKWINPGETLNSGEGAIIFNPTTDFKFIDFSGDVNLGNLSSPIPAGFSIRSSLVPQPGRLSTDLGFPVSDGDVIHLFDRDSQKYLIYPYPSKEWDSNPPVVGVGESFWVGKTSPGNWTRNFVVQ